MKKNLLKVLVVGCMVVSSVPTSVFASTVNTDNIKENTIEQTQEVGTLDSWLKEYILSLKGINNDEKQKLFESEKVIQSIYKQIDVLLDKAETIGVDVRVKIQEVDDKIYEIQNEDSKIMDKVHKYEESKLINEFDINEESLDDDNEENIYDGMVNYIKSLSILTASEKDKLLDTQKKLEPYYKELEALNKELDEVQQPIMDELDKLYDEVDKVYKDVAYIWDKVNQNY